MSDDSRILIEIDADGVPAERELKRTGAAIRTMSKEAQAEARKLAGVYQDASGRWREANGRFVASARQVEMGLKDVETQNQRTARSFDLTRRAGNGLSGMWRDQARSLKQLERAGIRTGQVVGGAVAGGLLLAGKEGLDFNATMETNTIGLNQFIKSGKSTQKFLDDLFKVARKTPFEFKDITEAAKKFLAFGFTVNETKKSLSAIGDATAALGGGADKIERLVIAFGQIQAKGRVQGDELLQLAEAGIPAYQILQEKLGLTSKEVAKIGTLGIQSGDAIAALVDGMNERFAGATARQSKSWKGMWSTIHDDTDQALGAMTKGLFDELEKNWLPKFDKTAQGIAAVWNRKDLTPEQKFERSRKIIEKELGPLFDKVEAEIAKLDIPGKLSDAFAAATPKMVQGIEKAALFGAKTYFEAFTKADPIGKALLFGFAAKKTGLGALVLGSLKGGKGAGGILSAAIKSQGSTPANPMFVAVINDLPGKGGGSLLDDILKKGSKGGAAAGGLRAFGARALPLAGLVLGAHGVIDNGAKNGIPTLQGGADIIQHINNSSESAREKVGRLDDAIGHLNEEFSGPGKSKLDPAYGKALQDLERYKGALADAADKEDHYVAQMSRAIEKLASSHGRSLTDIASTTDRRARSIRETLSTNSLIGRNMLAENFSSAASAIKTQMDAGAISVRTGTEQINKYLREAMKALGFDPTEIKHYMSSSTGDTAGKGSAGKSGSGQGAAKGMLNRLPGQVGPDSIPMAVNGRSIMAAPGEDVAIINRHQRAVLDDRLSDMGGLPGLFKKVDTPHHFARGGMVTGDTDYKPQVGSALERMAKATNTPIFVQSGGRTVAEQLALASTRSPSHPVAGPNGPHVRGVAADITPGRERFGNIAGRFGLAFTVPQESWHIQLIDEAIASGSMSKAQGEQIKRAMFKGPGGMVGALGQGSLDRYGAAAQSFLDQIAPAGQGDGTAPSLPSGTGGGATGSGAELMRRIAKQRGWNFDDWWKLDDRETSHGRNLSNPTSTARLRGQFLDMNYGKYGPGSDPAQHPSMPQQIESMADYIAERYHNPSDALAWHLVHNWYAKGGIVGAAGGLHDPSYSDWRSRATPTNGAKKGKKPPKPFTGGPAMPDLSKIKGSKVKPGSGKWKSSHGRFELGDIAGIDPGVLPDFDALFETPAGTITNQIAALQGRFDLSNEEPVVTLTDTGSFKDLTAFWAAHPDLAKTYKDQVDSFDVVNWDGMTVQGKQVPGIHQHTGELEQLLNLHSGSADGTGEGGLLGLRTGEVGSMTATAKRLSLIRDLALNTMRQIKHAWEAESGRREHAIGKTRKLNAGGQSWEQRVSDNNARIKALHDWKRKVSQDSVGHRKTEELQKQEAKATQDIADLQDENTTLKDTKPAPKHAVPRHATPKQRAKILRENEQRTGQLRHWTGVRDDAARELDYLDGSRERWQTSDGVAKGWQDRIDAHNAALKDVGDKLREITEATIPSEQLEIARLAQERGDWLGTQVTLPNLPDQKPDSLMADLLKQQLTAETTKRIVAESQFAVFTGFAPMVAGRSLGSFAKGTITPIAETGPAILHKDEIVIPDPQGAYGLNQRTSGGGGPVSIALHFADNSGQLVRLVDARVDGRAAKVVSEQLGRRQRMISISTGG